MATKKKRSAGLGPKRPTSQLSTESDDVNQARTELLHAYNRVCNGAIYSARKLPTERERVDRAIKLGLTVMSGHQGTPHPPDWVLRALDPLGPRTLQSAIWNGMEPRQQVRTYRMCKTYLLKELERILNTCGASASAQNVLYHFARLLDEPDQFVMERDVSGYHPRLHDRTAFIENTTETFKKDLAIFCDWVESCYLASEVAEYGPPRRQMLFPPEHFDAAALYQANPHLTLEEVGRRCGGVSASYVLKASKAVCSKVGLNRRISPRGPKTII